MRDSLRMVLLGGCLALAAATAWCANSGGYRGPQRNGIFPETGLLQQWPEGGPTLLWKVDNLGRGLGAVCVADGTVYVTGGVNPGYLMAYTLDGQLKWKKEYGPDFSASGRFQGPRATPMVSDGCVYVASGHKDQRAIYCFDAQTGDLKWSVDGNKEFGGAAQGWGYNETPVVTDKAVVITLRATNETTPPIVALDKKTGELLWQANPGVGNLSAGDCSATFVQYGKMRLIVDQLWRGIAVVDADTGRDLWRISTKGGTGMTPIFNEGYLLCDGGGTGTAVMYQLTADGKGFQEIWRQPGYSGICQALILNGRVYLFANSPTSKGKVLSWLCLDAKTGKLIKEQPAYDEGTMVAADGMLYWLEAGEKHMKQPKVSLVKPTADGFAVVSTFTPVVGTQELWNHPVIAEGRMFIRQGEVLSVYDLRANP